MKTGQRLSPQHRVPAQPLADRPTASPPRRAFKKPTPRRSLVPRAFDIPFVAPRPARRPSRRASLRRLHRDHLQSVAHPGHHHARREAGQGRLGPPPAHSPAGDQHRLCQGSWDRAQPEVEFHDIVCPWRLLLRRACCRLCGAAGGPHDYRPIQLGGVLKALGSGQADGREYAVRKAMTFPRHRSLGRAPGPPLQMPPEHPRRTVETMRLICGHRGCPGRRSSRRSLSRLTGCAGQTSATRRCCADRGPGRFEIRMRRSEGMGSPR